MPRFLPPLNALRAFEAAGRHQSFSRAADELGVAHSSVSRHVRGLEARLGVGLFREEAQGVALTEAGQRYLAFVGPAFDQIAEATEALAGRPEGVIVVNSEPFFAAKWLVPRLVGFRAAHPEIDLHLDATDTLIDLGRYQADMVIRFYKTGLPEADAMLLSNRPMYPYASPSIADRGIAAPGDMLRFELLQDRAGTVWEDWFTLARGAPSESLPKPGWRLRAALAIEAAVAGQGVILAGADIAEGYEARGELKRLFDIPLWQGGYYLLLREGAQRMKPVRQFRDWLLEVTQVLRIVQPDG